MASKEGHSAHDRQLLHVNDIRETTPTPDILCAPSADARQLFGRGLSIHVSEGELRIDPKSRDNDYLLSGYRPTSGSFAASLKSALSWHNETVNINSHLVGCLVFALLPSHFHLVYLRHIPRAELIDAVMFWVYSLGVATCFACSASCHIVWNWKPSAARFGNKFDFVGIVLLMWSAGIASIHFAFVCQPSLRRLHWTLMSISACSCIAFTVYPPFTGPTFRTYRAMVYASLGLTGVVFLVHGLYLWEFAIQRKRLSLEMMILMAALNLVGALLYATRFPECRYPYRFDIVGASHQLFHLLVLAAGLVHYRALSSAFLEVRGGVLMC